MHFSKKNYKIKYLVVINCSYYWLSSYTNVYVCNSMKITLLLTVLYFNNLHNYLFKCIHTLYMKKIVKV